jgi:hypothetical protein
MSGPKRYCLAIRGQFAQRPADARRKHHETGRVVKVVELERPVTLSRVRPGALAGHAEGHQEGRDGVSVRGEQIPRNGDSSL